MVLYVLASLAMILATRLLDWSGREGPWTKLRLTLVLALLLLIGASAVEFYGLWQSGLSFSDHAFGATLYTISGVNGALVLTLAFMVLFALARSFAGRLDGVRRAVFDNTRLLWHYAVLQGLAGLAAGHLSPRALG